MGLNFDYLNDIIIGFFVSFLFYFIVNYIPEKSRERLLGPYVKYRVETLIRLSQDIVNTIIKESSESFDFQNLTDKQLGTCCKKIQKPFQKKFPYHNGLGNISLKDIGQNIHNKWQKMNKQADELLNTPLLVDDELYRLLLEVFKKEKLSVGLSSLIELEYCEDLYPFKDQFYELYSLMKNLQNWKDAFDKKHLNLHIVFSMLGKLKSFLHWIVRNVKNNTYEFIKIFLLLVISTVFLYWFGVRPEQIRKDCWYSAINSNDYYSDYKYGYYSCLSKKGLIAFPNEFETEVDNKRGSWSVNVGGSVDVEGEVKTYQGGEWDVDADIRIK